MATSYSHHVPIRNAFITQRAIAAGRAANTYVARSPASFEAKAQGLRLQMLREALGKSQPQLGEIMGCAPNTVSSYESGRTRIDILNLQRLCAELRISADWIVSGAVHSLPEHLAVKIQAAQRAAQGAAPKRRGRPRKDPAIQPIRAAEPTTKPSQSSPMHSPARLSRPPGGTLHERPELFTGTVKNRFPRQDAWRGGCQSAGRACSPLTWLRRGGQ